MIEIKYTLKFKSDFHFGSGSGIPGVIDCGLKYNSNGVPEVGGKTVKGMIRDAVENIIYLSRSYTLSMEKMEGIVEEMFGKEGEDNTKFRFSTPTLIRQYEEKILKSKGLQKNISGIEFHNRINRKSHIAETGALFSRETGPGSFEYRGTISQIKECSNEKDLNRYLYFLICGMRFITHIGGNRRRGKGLARFEIEKINDKDRKISINYKEVIEKGIEE